MTREGTTPSLVRGLRAGTLDVAVLALRPPYRSPDTEAPKLVLERLADVELLLAVPVSGRLAGLDTVDIEQLADLRWIASPASGADPLLGVWPGLAGRPNIAHTARDWLTKLNFVAAGFGVTTVPAILSPAVPPSVRLIRIVGGVAESRRVVLARMPGPRSKTVADIARLLRVQAHLDPLEMTSGRPTQPS